MAALGHIPRLGCRFNFRKARVIIGGPDNDADSSKSKVSKIRSRFERRKSTSQACIDAGYKPCRQNAARLMTNDDVRTRLIEFHKTHKR